MSAEKNAPLKLQFEAGLPFQEEAIAAVRDVFLGQPLRASELTVLSRSSPAVGHRLLIPKEQVLANLRRQQGKAGLPPSDTIDLEDLNLTVEMETGTGKTYVYLRTLHELHKHYGFTRFIIVVPSVAIKEGVGKSLEITREHLAELYGRPPFHWFTYDSSNLGQIRTFVSSSHIQVMVATIQALHRTDLTLFHQPTEKLGGARPIDLIREVRPIVIVDEPQSVDGGDQGAGRQALRQMRPLFTLRYSATHVDPHHRVYRLDAVDAWEQHLVKSIEVASARVEGDHDRPFLRVEAVERKGRSNLFAQVELDCASAGGGVIRRTRTVHDGDDLVQVTGRQVYENMRIGEIVVRGKERRVQVLVPGSDLWLQPGQAWGGRGGGDGEAPLEALQRQMIRRTLRAHLDRELVLRPRGIKVLSLFFVDQVQHYRSYDAQGRPVPGRFARMFEEEYREAARQTRYKELFQGVDLEEVGQVHDGYFSVDKQRRFVDTPESHKEGRQAEAAYNLIMRDKERLLSLDTPLRFIFSHSALREGWDNPNVFQICSLREMGTDRQRRQSIGRGLRLCVNQEGCRVRDEGINRLTVVATESVREFAAHLQEDLERECGIPFGQVDRNAFASLPVVGEDGEPAPMGPRRSQLLWDWLLHEGYVDPAGKVQEKLARELRDGTFRVPPGFQDQEASIRRILRKLARGVEVKDADQGERVRPRREVLDHPEFRALWDRIKHRTAYRVEFDPEKLIQSCVEALQGPAFVVGRARITWTRAQVEIDRSGVQAGEEHLLDTPRTLAEPPVDLPDILTELQDRTGLTRRSLARILVQSEQLYQFRASPQAFIQAAADLINRQRREALVQGIQYERLGDSDFYALSLFEDQELRAFLGDNAVPSTKSPFEQVVYDSAGVERSFARFLEASEAVRFYVKLPGWFKIPTPLGTYNPDWAVLVEREGREKLLFVIETKGTLDPALLRGKEVGKIHCGRRHFEAVSGDQEPPVQYHVATSGQEFARMWE